MKLYSTKRLFALAALLAMLAARGAAPLAAQTILADPNDPIYAQIDAWATKGLLKNLPRLRPYTFVMTRGLLEEVAATGGPTDAELAGRYLDDLKDGAVHFGADARAVAAASSGGVDYALLAAPGLTFNTLMGDSLGLSARIEGWLADGANVNSLMPYGERYDRDPLYGSGSALSSSFEITQDIVSDLSYGNKDVGVQAGYMRGSWGPIYDDGVVIGPQAPESGQFTFSWRSPTLTADIGFLMLQQGWSSATDVRDSAGLSVGFNSQKYLIIHGINWAPKSWLEIGFIESEVWVDRFEPLYLLPLSEYFLSQAVASYGDNSFLGLSATAYLPHALKFDLVGYVDDINFASLLKGDLDSRWKVAAQACLSWAPESPLLQRVSLDYTIVGPYTYTHWEETGSDSNGNPYYGALAYTNAGENLGPALDPNSDRITLQAKSKERSGLRVSGLLRLIRHGNASAGVNGYNSTTAAGGDASGDLGDAGRFNATTNGGTWVFQGPYDTGTWPLYIRFLTQGVIQVSAQAGAQVDYSKLIPDIGILTAGLGYTFEYIANNGCVAGATSVKNYISVNLGLRL